MTVTELLEILLGLLIIIGSAYWLIAIYSVNRFFKPLAINSFSPATPVSILKPMKGIDPGFDENIRSFCGQDYSQYEVILGFNKPEQAEMDAVKRTVEPISCRNIRVVSSEIELGANSKVSNLQGMLDDTRNELIALSDSDMRVDKDYLKTIVSEYQGSNDVGMVTCLYKISDPRCVGTAFESLSITLDFLPSVLVAERFEGVSFGLGASMLFSKKTLDEIGGFKSVADYIADDYQIGNRIAKKGLKIVLSKYIIENVAGCMSMREYFLHQLRWARTVRVCRPAGYFGSGISHIIPFAAMLLMIMGIDAISLAVLGLVLALRIGVAALVYGKVIKTRAWLKWLVLLPVKDIASFIIWIGAFIGSKVSWRGSVYKILADGRIRRVSSE
jgi:ceramide glucosyltransferase